MKKLALINLMNLKQYNDVVKFYDSVIDAKKTEFFLFTKSVLLIVNIFLIKFTNIKLFGSNLHLFTLEYNGII